MEHFANFHERSFAEILAGEQLLFAGARQVAERQNTHLLQAITAANRQLKISNWNAEQLRKPIAIALCFFVVEHVSRSFSVLQEQSCPRMIWMDFQNPLVALASSFVLLHIFVKNTEIQ